MGKFRDLLGANNHLPPGEQQRLASQLLPAAVASTRMSMWSPGESFPTSGTRVLIGVVVWSMYDLDLLDDLDPELFGHDSVYVFDADSCKQMSDFEKYIPGIGNVFQTPVVGLWQDGELLYCEQGAAARNWIRNRYVFTQT